MAVADVGPGLVAAATRGLPCVYRAVRHAWHLTVAALAAVGGVGSGYGSTHHLMRALCLPTDGSGPADDAAVRRYADLGVRQVERYLAAAARGRIDRIDGIDPTERPFDGP
jgi:hypothetical protein